METSIVIVLIVFVVFLFVLRNKPRKTKHKSTRKRRGKESVSQQKLEEVAKLGRKLGYVPPEQLGAHPGTLKFKIYKAFCEGKTPQKIEGELESHDNGIWDFFDYILRFQKKMRGELRLCPSCKTFMVEKCINSSGNLGWYCEKCKMYLKSAPPPGDPSRRY